MTQINTEIFTMEKPKLEKNKTTKGLYYDQELITTI